MSGDTWDLFVIYVNCYSAIEETHDALRRRWERPDAGLTRFCRDANPFVFDEQGSFEEALYEGFAQGFTERFESNECTASEGYAYCHDWLSALEDEGTYGTGLVAALDETASEAVFASACDQVMRQVWNRSARIERTPQDEPFEVVPPARHEVSPADIEAVIELLAKGDEALAESLRARLNDGA